MANISQKEMDALMKKCVIGIVVKSTEKDINFEFWSKKNDSMIKRWIPKSAIIFSIKTFPDNRGSFYHECNKLGHSEFENDETVWLKLSEWAYKKIILGIDLDRGYQGKQDYADWEIEEDQDFRMDYDF